jgi:hypothetical protein
MSLGVFTLVNVALDVESVSNILLHRWPIHGPLHTVPGSLAVAAVGVITGKPLLTRINRLAAAWLERSSATSAVTGLRTWMVRELRPVSWTGALLGASLAALSHVALDALMHHDVQPLWPLRGGNVLHVDGIAGPLHAGTALAGLLGWLLWRRDGRGVASTP